MEVREVDNPRLTARYEAYKGHISSEQVPGSELLMFHGCAPVRRWTWTASSRPAS
eukprot:COSAG04_NODE_1764_length_5651_cov_2.599244_1_plen_55_part_00